jgi:hypothetical protein
MTWTRTSSAGPTMKSWATVKSVRSVRPTIREELTPLEMPPVRQPKALKTYRVTWVIEVEADTPLSAARRARFNQTTEHDGLRSFRGLSVRRSALRAFSHDRLDPDAD